MRLTANKNLLEQMTVEALRQNLVLLKAESIEIARMHLLELIVTIQGLEKEIEWFKQEAKKIPEICLYEECCNKNDQCDNEEHPQICPKYQKEGIKS